jgi:hypothetical protein
MPEIQVVLKLCVDEMKTGERGDPPRKPKTMKVKKWAGSGRCPVFSIRSPVPDRTFFILIGGAF